MGWFQSKVLKKQKKMLKRLKRFRREAEMRFNQLSGKADAQMAVSQDIKDLCVQLDAATNDIAADGDAIAARLDTLIAQIGSGVSPQDAADIVKTLTGLRDRNKANADRLRQLAADPANPVPTP